MNTEMLLKFADRLDELHRGEIVGMQMVAPGGFLFDLDRFWSPHTCGMAGCAIGWAANDPVLIRLFRPHQPSTFHFSKALHAIERACGIEEERIDDFQNLFLPRSPWYGDHDATAADVAAAIRRFVAGERPSRS